MHPSLFVILIRADITRYIRFAGFLIIAANIFDPRQNRNRAGSNTQ
jgi:hypothetical protein